jgi:Domain of unknown function (DUF4157)
MDRSAIQRKARSGQDSQDSLHALTQTNQVLQDAASPPSTEVSSEPRFGHAFDQLEVFPKDVTSAQSAANSNFGTPATHANGAALGAGPAASSTPAIQRGGNTIPGGAAIEITTASGGAIVNKLRSLGSRAGGGFGGNADWDTNALPMIESAIAANLNPRSISGSWTETRGLNVRWNWRVTFRMGAPREISGGGVGTSEFGTGGTGSVGTSSSTATTDSASVTGGGGYQSGPETARSSGSASATVGTSTTRTDGTSTTSGLNTAGKTGASTNQVRYSAPVIAECYVAPELDMSGSDYVNPFKWGMFAGEAMDPMQRLSEDCETGEVRYYLTNGIAGGGPPAQRKGWVEHELGITEELETNAARSLEAQTLSPEAMSRSGAQKLPSALAEDAEAFHGQSMQNVNLVVGSHADQYADTMSAAAFTTPNTEGGSDIFVHSDLDLNSTKGQHTLQHEVAHAVQNMKGQTSELTGLGGDETQRANLERTADSDAQAILERGRGSGKSRSGFDATPNSMTSTPMSTSGNSSAATQLKKRDA